MPPRVARSGLQPAAGKAKQKTKRNNRAQNAFAIAGESSGPSKPRRQHRLGEILDDDSAQKHKRRRAAEDEDGDDESAEEDAPDTKRPRVSAGDDDIEEGSDEEGHRWTMGGLADDDDDSDIDSDEAFGSSDDEKFEGFSFKGSSSHKKVMQSKGKAPARGNANLDLSEGEGSEEDDGEVEDDFGDEGVDLATMLDDEDEETPGGKHSTEQHQSEESSDHEVDDDSASDSASDESEEDDGADEERVARMRDRLEALDEGKQMKGTAAPASQPAALSVDDLLADLDPSAKKQFTTALKTRSKTAQPTTLTAPLPKRQQDRLDRQAASAKAKEQLDRWRDTVIRNRRADFRQFPLKDPDQGEPLGKDKFVTDGKPQGELEENIRKIMEESGMATGKAGDDGEAEEDAILKSEELSTNKLPVEEVMRRRAELRKARELMFREEKKAKRVSKIKSKAYRRVHRKEKERMAEKERELLGDQEMGEDEKEQADRHRAEARMSTKHGDSKWAKSLKQANRGAWDEGAREAVMDQARREEELRRRVQGKDVEEGSDSGSDDDDDDDDDGDDDARTAKQLFRLKEDSNTGEQKGVGGMKFMRDADARRRVRNDEDVDRLRKDLAIQDGDEDDDVVMNDQGLGRAIFGPKSKEGSKLFREKKAKSEMEEGDASSDDEPHIQVDEADQEPNGVANTPRGSKKQPNGILKELGDANGPLTKGSSSGAKSAKVDASPAAALESSWLSGSTKKVKKGQRSMADNDALINVQAEPPAKQDETQQRKGAAKPKSSTAEPNDTGDAGNTNGWTTVSYNNETADNAADSDDPSNPVLTAAEQKTVYHRRAFAGDDVQAAFKAEKDDLMADEAPQETSAHLPGWGSWTGTGLSKSVRRANNKAKHNPLYKNKTAGTEMAKRKDKNMDKVIVSEKKDRKAGKYLADSLPFGVGGKEEYERGLRGPVGPEWTTKEVFQRGTKPRVVVKPGTVVEPVAKPQV